MGAIDSLKVRIPANQVDVLYQGIINYWVPVDTVSGEVDSESYKSKRHRVSENGITTSYAYLRGGGVKSLGDSDWILIMFNSKILKSLEGITETNIKDVYNSIISHQIVYFSYDSFLKSICTDIDIKQDTILAGGIEQQIKAMKALGAITKPTKTKNGGYDLKRQSTNVGIQWSKRELATNSCPYVKVYAKDIELQNNSKKFFFTYINSVPEGLTRVECTIKNKKHFEYLTEKKLGKSLTLELLLSISSVELDNFIKAMSGKHIEQSNLLGIEKDSTWSLSDAFCMAYLKKCDSMSLAKHDISAYTKDKAQTYNARVKIEQIWSKYIEETEQGKEGKELDKLFNVMGIGE